MSLSIGDSVKVMWHDELPEGNFTDSHRALNGREGKVRRVDTDGTALVDVDGHGVWLWLTGLEVVESGKWCSCGGPGKAIPLLTSAVVVCTVCGKDKQDAQGA